MKKVYSSPLTKSSEFKLNPYLILVSDWDWENSSKSKKRTIFEEEDLDKEEDSTDDDDFWN